MGNQQAKDLDLAWLAGFFDGEGCIDFPHQPGRRLRIMHLNYYYPRVRLVNTHQDTLQVVRDILDANGLAYHVSNRGVPKQRGHLPAWDITAQGFKRSKRWLEVLAPYLRTKQQKAFLALEFINSRLNHSTQDGYSAHEVELLEQLRGSPIQLQRPHADLAS